MSDQSVAIPKRPRLKFIDMARSIAIILMLEGHFVHDSLYIPSGIVDGVYTDNIYQHHPVFMTWAFIRGFTSAIFLTVTGLIFVYLLLMDRETPWTKNERVKKGGWRVLELLFWGYVLQPKAFHVLQCIGIGIGLILLIFGLYKFVKKIPLWIWFLFIGMLLFYLGMELQQWRKALEAQGVPYDSIAWPRNAPAFIQNMLLAPADRSLFPIVPNVGFTMIGASVGCLLHDLQKYVKTWGFALTFIVLGAVFFFAADPILTAVDEVMKAIIGETRFKNITMNWIMYKVGMVFMVLGVLMVVEKLLGDIKQNLFLKVGQNTLSIYIVHMIILYGAISGLGLSKSFHHNLTPYEAALGALLFIMLFFVFTKYIEVLRSVYNKFLNTVLPWRKPKSA